MEPFVDFGLLELLGILALASLSRDARRRFSRGLARAGAKLGRCLRCMTITAIGLSVSSLAILWLGPQVTPVVRVPVYLIAFGFAALAALHVSAIVYRALARLETSVSRVAGGCQCTASSRRTDR